MFRVGIDTLHWSYGPYNKSAESRENLPYTLIAVRFSPSFMSSTFFPVMHRCIESSLRNWNRYAQHTGRILKSSTSSMAHMWTQKLLQTKKEKSKSLFLFNHNRTERSETHLYFNIVHRKYAKRNNGSGGFEEGRIPEKVRAKICHVWLFNFAVFIVTQRLPSGFEGGRNRCCSPSW